MIALRMILRPHIAQMRMESARKRISSLAGSRSLWHSHRIKYKTLLAYRYRKTRGRREYRCMFRWDSDLEAFNRKPSDGSFAPSAVRPST